MKNKNNNTRREKTNQNGHGKAALFTLGFCYIFLIVEIGYKIKVAREVCTWEIILIFLMLSVYGIFQKLFCKSEIPTNLRGEPLPTGKAKQDKRRRRRFYAINALVYSLLIAVAIIIIFVTSSDISEIEVGHEMFFDTDMSNFSFALILSACLFPITYIVSFMVEYVWYEYKISQYNLLMLIRAEAHETADNLLKEETPELPNENQGPPTSPTEETESQ